MCNTIMPAGYPDAAGVLMDGSLAHVDRGHLSLAVYTRGKSKRKAIIDCADLSWHSVTFFQASHTASCCAGS